MLRTDYISNQSLQFGLGVSKVSGQYKVLCINEGVWSDSHRVYTLGTGTWRRVKAGAASSFRFWGVPIICNDNLHWRAYDSRNRIWVVCGFDVECFSVFYLLPAGIGNGKLSVLRDCVCYSNYTRSNGEIFIWMMKEYQVNESWTIGYKMSTTDSDLSFRRLYIHVEAIKHFKDGDVLMLLDHSILVYSSNYTRTLQQVNMLNDTDAKKCYALIFNPSLLSLESFGFENVISF
ncbi:F-box protein CPR1-like [Salvia splendens]|uniref:F-box protein CPR1-like n=1 Tax=Salvia splendens TaxID=180675 RepID=UPI001C2526DA|nr:F-box protein CPR1-like [Salvia splendens]